MQSTNHSLSLNISCGGRVEASIAEARKLTDENRAKSGQPPLNDAELALQGALEGYLRKLAGTGPGVRLSGSIGLSSSLTRYQDDVPDEGEGSEG